MKHIPPTFLKVLPLLLVCLVFPLSAHADGPPLWVSILWAFVNGLFGTLMAIAGTFLDYTTTEYVVNFGSNYINKGIGGQVDKLWVTVRDIFNMTFIFGLVYIGFKMILDSDNSQTRRWLVNLIIAALLVNFSLFFVKFTIDISNQLATQIAAPMVTNGVSHTFAQAMGATSIWATDASAIPLQDDDATGATFGYIFGAMIIFIVGTFVFASGAFMLLIRYIVLHVYLIMSPFMFIGFVFPWMQSTTRKYWEGLLGKAFYAPIFMLMLYFAASILNAIGVGGNMADAFGVSGGAVAVSSFDSTIPPFLLASGFLLAAVIVANKLGADGAQTAINIGNNIRSRAQRRLKNAAYKTAAYAPSKGLNVAGEAAAKRLDRTSASLAQGGAVSRFMARRLDNTAGAAARAAAGASIMGTETVAQKRDRVDKQQKRFNDTAKANKREGDFYTHRAEVAAQQAILDDAATQGIDRQRAETLKANAEAALGAVIKEMSPEELMALKASNDGFRADESTGLALSAADILSDPVLARHFTPEQMKAFGDSGRFTNDEMKGIGKTRTTEIFGKLEGALQDNSATAEQLADTLDELTDVVQKYSESDVVKLGTDNLKKTHIAANLTQKQLDAIVGSGKFTEAEIAEIKIARSTGLSQIAADGSLHFERYDPTTGKTTSRALNPALDIEQVDFKDRGNVTKQEEATSKQQSEFRNNQRKKLLARKMTDGSLPISVFTSEDMAPHLTPQALEQRMKDSYVSETDLETIRKNVDNHLRGLSGDAKKRQQKLWRTWTNRTTYGAQLGLTEIGSDNDDNRSDSNSNSAAPGLITPDSPNWNGGATGPRPGPQA